LLYVSCSDNRRLFLGWQISNMMEAEWCREIAEAAVAKYGCPQIILLSLYVAHRVPCFRTAAGDCCVNNSRNVAVETWRATSLQRFIQFIIPNSVSVVPLPPPGCFNSSCHQQT
jgi:hypothetical protein